MSRQREVTTLGRGGSDTSAVALAVALRADRCEIYTDVPGIFTADPRRVPDARVIPEISYEEMLEMASAGAQVMHAAGDRDRGALRNRSPRRLRRSRRRGARHKGP